MHDYGLSIKIARIYVRESGNGNRYFAGELGRAKIVILKSDHTADDGTPVWDVLLQEAPRQKPDKGLVAKAKAQGEPASRANVNAPLNNEVPF